MLRQFFVLFLLYSRVFPVLALNEVKTILRATGEFGVKKAKSTEFSLTDGFSSSVVEDKPTTDDSSEDSSDDTGAETNKEQE